MTEKKQKILIIVLAIAGQIAIGAASGAVAGAIVAERVQNKTSGLAVNFQIPQQLNATGTSDQTVGNTPSVSSTIKLLPLAEVQINERVVPESISNRKSPLAILFNAKKITLESGLNEQAEFGRAVAVTSDGWLAAPASIFSNLKKDDIIVYYQNTRYKVLEAVSDDATQVVFIKTDIRDLPATSFAQHRSQQSGIALWFEPQNKQFLPSSLVAVRKIDYPEVVFSDTAVRRLVAGGQADAAKVGSPLWDAGGSLVGIAEKFSQGEILAIPGSAISTSLQSLVSNGDIRHATLGVYALDLALSEKNSGEGLPERGARITAPTKLKSGIIKGGAAEAAGLKNGDVILEVDRDIMDGSLDLGDIILQFRPEVSVKLRIWRQGEELDVSVKFGNQVTSKQLP